MDDPTRIAGDFEVEYAAAVADGVIVSHGSSNRSDTTTWTADHLTFTRVLVQRRDTWRIAASHVSEPSKRGDPRSSRA